MCMCVVIYNKMLLKRETDRQTDRQSQKDRATETETDRCTETGGEEEEKEVEAGERDG